MTDVDKLQNAEEWAAQRENEAREATRAEEQARLDELRAAQQRSSAQDPRRTVEVPLSQLSLVTNIRTGELPEIHGLAMNIREVGLIHPLLVKQASEGEFKVIAGKRRYAALEEIARATDEDPTVRCELIESTSEEDNVYLLQLSENLGREDMPPLAVARGLRAALKADPDMSASQLARSLGKSPAWASRHLHLLDLPADIQQRLDDGDLNFTIADLLQQGRKKGIITDENIEEVAASVAAGDTTVDELKKMVRPPTMHPTPENYEELARELDAARFGPDQRGFEPDEVGMDAEQRDWDSGGVEEEFRSSGVSPADNGPVREAPVNTGPLPWDTSDESAKQFKPARERYGVRQLEAFLIGKLLREQASDRLREVLSVTEEGAYAWAWHLSEEDRKSVLQELAADFVERADDELPREIFPADSQ